MCHYNIPLQLQLFESQRKCAPGTAVDPNFKYAGNDYDTLNPCSVFNDKCSKCHIICFVITNIDRSADIFEYYNCFNCYTETIIIPDSVLYITHSTILIKCYVNWIILLSIQNW